MIFGRDYWNKTDKMKEEGIPLPDCPICGEKMHYIDDHGRTGCIYNHDLNNKYQPQKKDNNIKLEEELKKY